MREDAMKREPPKIGDFVCGGSFPAVVVIEGEPITSSARPQPQSSPSLAEIDRRLRDFKVKLDAFTAELRAAKRQ
jgi:hypothetical protein